MALSTFAMLCNHSPFPELVHHPKQKLCPHWTFHSSPPPAPDNLHSTICLYELADARYLIQVESYNICPFVFDLFHLA